VLYPARDTIDGGEQSGLPVIGPEQGDPGEVIDTNGEQRRLEQRTLLDRGNRGQAEEPEFWMIALQCRSRGSTSILECHGKGNAAHCSSDLTIAI